MHVGNFPDLQKSEVDEIVSIINKAVSKLMEPIGLAEEKGTKL